MLSTRFGIEIEFTGISRRYAAIIARDYLHGEMRYRGGSYDAYTVQTEDGRIYKFVYDSSIMAQMKEDGRIVYADDEYAVEFVSPILKYYDDIVMLQGLIRRLRKNGGFTNSSCGIHIHLDGSRHTVRSLVNFINLVASRNDLFYKALRISPDRSRYCKKLDEKLVRNIREKKPKTMDELKAIWYDGYNENRSIHYHSSRYHFLNLHSYFQRNHTVELRGFNSELHASKVRAYIVFALAMNHQALTQRRASSRKVQSENEKFAMRVYLVRIGLSGDEFKSCRMHLYEHLSGNAAWRYGSKENCRSHRKKDDEEGEDDEPSQVSVVYPDGIYWFEGDEDDDSDEDEEISF